MGGRGWGSVCHTMGGGVRIGIKIKILEKVTRIQDKTKELKRK